MNSLVYSGQEASIPVAADGQVAPHRVQLSRAKGWRMPANTVKVTRGRGMRWGNPFDLSKSEHCWTAIATGFKADKAGRRAASVELFRRWLVLGVPAGAAAGLYADKGEGTDRVPLVESPTIIAGAPPSLADIREHLAGKNLACWCPHDGQPCHADVLLELANAVSSDALGTKRSEVSPNPPVNP